MTSDFKEYFDRNAARMGFTALTQGETAGALSEARRRFPTLAFGMQTSATAGRLDIVVTADSSTTKTSKSSTFDGQTGNNPPAYDVTGAQKDQATQDSKMFTSSGAVQQSETSELDGAAPGV